MKNIMKFETVNRALFVFYVNTIFSNRNLFLRYSVKTIDSQDAQMLYLFIVEMLMMMF